MDGDGGGIANYYTLTLSKSTVSGNTATNGEGGGISNDFSGTLTLIDSTVSGNTATGGGGGISSNGTLTLTNSTVSGNSSTRVGEGGGIDNNLGTLTLSTSTVSGNTAYDGGGIDNNGGRLALSNSTVSSNSATRVGGGIFVQSQSSTAQDDLTFGTIYGNMASVGADIAVEDVALSNGKFKSVKQISHVRISNSIVASNPAHPGPDISGTLIAFGYNLFQDNSGATFDPATRTQHGTDRTLSVGDLSKLFAPPVVDFIQSLDKRRKAE